MNYSQNNEDIVVEQYFKDYVGTCLSIGENNGKDLSNCLLLIEKGWTATLVEPSPASYIQLCDLHRLRNNVDCHCVAISNFNGEADFFESGSHLKDSDHSLLSSLSESEISKWRYSTHFSKIKVDVMTFYTFMEESNNPKFDFISIDAEGQDLIILKQMDLKELDCKCLCIEWNSHPEILKEIIEYCAQFGLTQQLLKNAENIILAI